MAETTTVTIRDKAEHEIGPQHSDAKDRLSMLQGGLEATDWEATIQNVITSVVSIQFCYPLSFDGNKARRFQATGFVVDADRG
jgi:hypothetical protein